MDLICSAGLEQKVPNQEQKVPINIYIESLIDKEFSYLSASLPDKENSQGTPFQENEMKIHFKI